MFPLQTLTIADIDKITDTTIDKKRRQELILIERFVREKRVTLCPNALTTEFGLLPTLAWKKGVRRYGR